MKAYQIQTAVGIDGLKLVDLPEPKPGVGQGQISRVRAVALRWCYRDLVGEHGGILGGCEFARRHGGGTAICCG
jgi:hypothetical protein